MIRSKELTKPLFQIKPITISKKKKRVIFKALSAFVLIALFTFFIVLAVQNSSPFLTEIGLGTAMVGIPFLLNVFSKE